MLAMLDRLIYASIVYNGVTGRCVCSCFIDLLLNTRLGIVAVVILLVIRRIVLLVVVYRIVLLVVVYRIVLLVIVYRIVLLVIRRLVLILFGIVIGHLNNNAENYFVSHSSAVTIFARRPPSIIRR